MTDQLRWSDIVGAVATAMSVKPHNFTMLNSRAKNLLKLGLLPDRSQKGRIGAAHRYTEQQGFEVFLATALNMDGIAPAHVVRLVSSRRPIIWHTAQAGKPLILKPEGALDGKRCARRVMIWPLGAMLQQFREALAQ